MSGAQRSRTFISFSTASGEGYNLMRQALVRMVLAVEQASIHRRSWTPGWSGELCLALAPICPTPHVDVGAHPSAGLPWSRLIDLDHLVHGTGVPVVELENVVAAYPAAPWRLLELRRSPRIMAMLPMSGVPPDCWERRIDDPDGPADPVGCRCRPADWLRWSSVQSIDAFFSPGSTFLARETCSHPGHDVGGIFVAHAETMSWGGVQDSAAFWRVVGALRPAPGIRELAAAHRPPEPYLGVHWRRGDFRNVHADHSPSPDVAAQQIAQHARSHALRTVFVATDTGHDEIEQLRAGLEAAGLSLVTLQPEAVPALSDLERAAVEQAILFECAVFVGTRRSTFTHTVFETREASRAWAPEATWNVLCGDAHHPGRADDPAFGPVEPRRPFRSGNVTKERAAGPDSVLFVLGESVSPGAESTGEAIERWAAPGRNGTRPDVRPRGDFGGGKPGAWTILPALAALADGLAPGVDWVFFAPADLPAGPWEVAEWLTDHDGRSGGFVGRVLRDVGPTAIHHYRQEPLSHPDFSCGFAVSRSLVGRLADHWRSRIPSAGFHIDPQYELAEAVRACGTLLTDEPRLAGLVGASPPSPISPVRAEDVVFAVKTHRANHRSRIPVLQRTWGRDAPNLVVYSDAYDPTIPTIPVGIPNSNRGHGRKFHIIARHLLGHHGEREWFVIADDDTLLSVPRLLQVLGSFAARRDEPLFIGQRYGYGHGLADGGYDYITMGGGLVINRCGLVALLEANDAPGIDTPDDMWVGLCLKEMGVEVVHHEGFHQEPPSAYPPEVLAQRQAVSFHRHAPDDPDEVYARFLAQ